MRRNPKRAGSVANFLPLKHYMFYCLDRFMFWDFAYPVFWAMRRMYTGIKAPAPLRADKASATKASATVNAWDWPIVSRLLDRSAALWYPVHRLQFRLFRNATGRGHEFFALARKPVVS